MGFSLRDSEQFLPLYLGPTAEATLQEFLDIDVRVDDLARILRGNRAYLNLFREFVGQKVREVPEEDPGAAEPKRRPRPTPTRRLVGLLGMIGSRNLILVLRMNEAVCGRFPLDAEGKLAVKTSTFLKCATQGEDFFARNNRPYGEAAFAAGVLFDWIYLHLKETGHLPELEQFFQETWKQALRSGAIGYELARRVPGQIPAQGFLNASLPFAGKLLLSARAGPAYRELLAAQKADPRLDSLAKLLQERAAFGTSFEEVAAQALGYFSVFKGHATSVRWFREPYFLSGHDGPFETAAHLAQVAEAAGLAKSLPTSEQDPALLKLAPRSAAKAGLSSARLLEALKAAAGHR